MATMGAVSEIIDDRAYGYGWWYHLKPGWKRDFYEYHAVRAMTKRELNLILKNEVVPCNCAECEAAICHSPASL